MLHIQPKDIPVGELHQYLLGAVGPRPIALASTLDQYGNPNLSPFSFFNVFSANPPIAIFSPARRVRNNTTKHTLDNILETKEVVINIVNYAMVQQMSLASTEYDAGVDEFIKAGFTKVESEAVKPFRVKESPVQLECKVKEVVAMGDDGGAGNLVICEVLRMHLHEEILDEAGRIDDHKIDLVARMGGNWYTRAIDGMFEVPKPLRNLGVGVDQIPEAFRTSSILTGNDLGRLGNVDVLPQAEEIRAYLSEDEQLQHLATDKDNPDLHLRIKELISNNKILEAWKLILA